MKEKTSKQNMILFCLTFLLSAFGYEFIFFIMTLYVFNLSNSAIQVSIFTALTFIPKFISPFFGGLADRFSREKVLGIANLAACVLLPGLAYTQKLAIIYPLWFLISVDLMVIMTVRGTLLAELIPSNNYKAGNSTMLVLSNGARLLAPLIGGAATLVFSMKALVYTVCVIYLVAAVLSFFLKLKPVAVTSTTGKQKGYWASGFKTIMRIPVLRYLESVSFLWRLFLGLQISLFVVYVESFLHGNDAQYGYFIAFSTLGSILGSLAGSKMGKRWNASILIPIGLGLHYASFAVLGLTDQLWLACGIVFFSFFAFYGTLVHMHTLRDRHTPSELRGRVYGMVTALNTPSTIISMLVGGALVRVIGVNRVLFIAGMLAVVSLLAATLAQPNWERETGISGTALNETKIHI